VAEEDDARVNSVNSDAILPTEREVLKEMEANEDCQQTESLIQSAAFHVAQAQLQRLLAIQRATKSMEDVRDGVHHTKRRYVLVGDYTQNVGLPHFGGEQPGDTYHFSPLTIFLFGLVDLLQETTTM
jgi:hypothetical protein